MFAHQELIGFGAAASSGLVNSRSLQFTAASSQALSRSWGTSGTTSNKVMTFSAFYKRASTGAAMAIFCGGESTSNNELMIRLDASNKIEVRGLIGGVVALQRTSTATFTDTSGWHHYCTSIDMAQATAANRVRVYHDGTEITSWATDTVPAQNTALPWNNYNTTYYIGRLNYAAVNYYDGLLDELIYVDGQQLLPTDFASGATPIAYAGTYGTKGFRLRFEDNTSTTTLGQEDSGNGLNWTLVNMSTSNSSTTVP